MAKSLIDLEFRPPQPIRPNETLPQTLSRRVIQTLAGYAQPPIQEVLSEIGQHVISLNTSEQNTHEFSAEISKSGIRLRIQRVEKSQRRASHIVVDINGQEVLPRRKIYLLGKEPGKLPEVGIVRREKNGNFALETYLFLDS